ncbi:MAG TPA: HAD-IA family hydrolase [Actinospica sp.]|nr:HAD-IA family hydrolase [Actinospica sp.]
MHLPRISALLFDMDGTLVDSDAAVDRAWITWCAEYGIDARLALRLAPGHPAADTVARLLGARDPDISQEALAAAAARELEFEYDDLSDVVAADGALELLALVDELALPWAVVTSADERLARARLGAAGIAAPVLITTDDIPRGKPDPAGYLRAAELLGVPIEGCLVVEDAEPGVLAGRAAGARVAGLKSVPADYALTGLHELTAALASAFAASAEPPTR